MRADPTEQSMKRKADDKALVNALGNALDNDRRSWLWHFSLHA